MSKADFIYINRFRKTEEDSTDAITNYRISNRDVDNRIRGGQFCVPDLDYAGLLNRYSEEVLKPGKIEFLTEAQLKNNGAILVDLDFRFPYETTERKYTPEHLAILIDTYIEELSKIYTFDEGSSYKIYVLEKKTVNREADKNRTKDGIHLIIGISSERSMQMLLRSRIINRLKDVLNDIPITNTWEDVVDNRISNGQNHWQMYGSTKPGYEPYHLTHIYTVGYDPCDGQPMCEVRSDKDADWCPNWKVLIHELSARCKNHPVFKYSIGTKRELQKIENSNCRNTLLELNEPQRRNNYQTMEETTSFTSKVLTVQTRDDLPSSQPLY